MEGWWCVRHGDALAWVEAPTAPTAVQRSLDLHPLGDWTADTGELVVFPQDAYPENAGPHDYTRAVVDADSSPRRRRAGPRKARPAPALACLAAAVALGFGLAHDVSAETWRGLTVAPEIPLRAVRQEAGLPLSPVGRARHRARAGSGVRALRGHGASHRLRQTDIEHIVAASEAHDSGLCAADRSRHGPDSPATSAI